MRLFAAIDIPEDVCEQVEAVCRGLPDIRWTPMEQMHITLRFLGDEISEDRRETLADALSQVAAPGFRLRLRGIGRFLNDRAPDVLWAGVEAAPELLELQRQIEARLAGIGVAREKRAYVPHLTLARLKNTPLSRVEQYMELYSDFSSDPFNVDEFVLFSSTLRPGGAVHEVEEVYSLS